MSNYNDYENDRERSLRRTDPYGVETDINNDVTNSTRACKACGLSCMYAKAGKCSGEVNMLSDVGGHVCDEHKKMLGGKNRWYMSEPTKEDGLVQRELGQQLSNWGGTYQKENEANDYPNKTTKKDCDL